MKVDLKQLDRVWMKELFRKHYGMEIPLGDIQYLATDSHVKVWSDCIDSIMVWHDGTKSTQDVNLPPLIGWDIECRLRCCGNCKWWDKLDMSCAKSGDAVHESNHNSAHEKSDKAFLYINDDPVDVEVHKQGTDDDSVTFDGYFDGDDIEERVTVCFGANHSCGDHEYKED